MRLLIASTVTLAMVALGACKNPNANVAPAATSAATTPAPVPAASASEHLALDAAASRVGFTGAKVTGSHEGSFSGVTGAIDLDPARVEQSRVSVTVDTTTVTTDTERLTGHLKSPDFFDVARFPQATFVSTQIVPGGAQGATHTITGNLSLHGVTRAVTFPATVTVSPASVSATAEFSINRRDFGIVYAGMPDNLIRDEVAMHLRLVAPRGR